MSTLCFRAPGIPMPLDALLLRALPQAPVSLREDRVARGAVRVAGRTARRLRAQVDPGQRVEVSDVARDAKLPAATRCRVLAPASPWSAGTLAPAAGCERGVVFALECARGPVAEWLAGPAEGGEPPDAERFASDLLRTLAAAGMAVLGDVVGGGVLVEGGLRLRPADAPEPEHWWPDEPVFAGWAPDEAPPRFQVSAATSRVLGRGHPWVLRDDDTDDASALAPGTRVELVDPGGRALGRAHVEGPARLTARVWSRGGDGGPSVEARVAKALARRDALFGSADTDAFRLVHGEADGLPGLFADRLGGLLRVLVASAGTARYRERAVDTLLRSLEARLGAAPAVVEVVHLRERPAGELSCVRLLQGEAPDPAHVVRERGLAYRIESGLERPHRSSPGVGLYLDQRDNRARLAAGRGGRLLNLFAHTGAFSVAWLAAGQGEAVSVDLSAGYLRWLEENLDRNGIDRALHRKVKQDGRRFLESLPPDERFEAIVLDPPTAAAAGRRFWSVGRELPGLVGRALCHLAPGGRLLVSRNDRRGAGLEALVRRAAEANGVSLSRVQPAPPGPDFPSLAAFPEGDPFSAVWATRR